MVVYWLHAILKRHFTGLNPWVYRKRVVQYPLLTKGEEEKEEEEDSDDDVDFQKPSKLGESKNFIFMSRIYRKRVIHDVHYPLLTKGEEEEEEEEDLDDDVEFQKPSTLGHSKNFIFMSSINFSEANYRTLGWLYNNTLNGSRLHTVTNTATFQSYNTNQEVHMQSQKTHIHNLIEILRTTETKISNNNNNMNKKKDAAKDHQRKKFREFDSLRFTSTQLYKEHADLGCSINDDDGHKEVICHTEEALYRAKSLVNIEFSWYLVLVTILCMLFYLILIRVYGKMDVQYSSLMKEEEEDEVESRKPV
ncbi:hypothetical protein HS088_TW15G01237 [Tripterygium wilfordii]|uniref:Uncharacterized protein n=1 Tax=Tripterygium wilfordii TaxID=458696 RepID=A0A7J7CNQ4_TRIWF|nr:hypothetical protein HS088_TW15G01237 [Tripterygium wilfordii]